MRLRVNGMGAHWLALVLLAGALAGCGSADKRATGQGGIATVPAQVPDPRHPRIDSDLPAMPAAGSGRGGYYQDDGPGDNPPPNLLQTPDAIVKAEPYAVWANKPYTRFGKRYVPMLNDEPFTQRGVGSWYGKKFHGQRTSSGELYDMYKMTAAHPTLPIPSYARVTSIQSGKQVVVRINDRGPFHASRVIDLSFTAALKLGLLGKGSHEVVVERLFPGPAHAEESVGEARRNAPAIPLPAASTQDGGGIELRPVSLPGAAQVAELAPTMAPPAVAAGLPAEAPALASQGPAAVPMPGGFYVQLGAFSRAELAERFRKQLAAHASVLGPLEIALGGTLHRVYSGPFATRAQAAQAISALPSTLPVRSIVVRR